MSYTRINPDSERSTSPSLFTAKPGITVESLAFERTGKVAQLELRLMHDEAWSVGAQYNVGIVANGYRPRANAGGVIGTYGVAVLLTGGSVYIRPLFATETAAGSTSYVRFTYLLA